MEELKENLKVPGIGRILKFDVFQKHHNILLLLYDLSQIKLKLLLPGRGAWLGRGHNCELG